MATVYKCVKCSSGTSDYNCMDCVILENEKLREEVSRLKDQGHVACDLFDELKKSQGEVRDLRELCREAFVVIRDAVTIDRLRGIEICVLQGNLWRATNGIVLSFEKCGTYLKTTTGGVSDKCALRPRHEGKCEKVS